jgi:hypothetical protein
VLSAICLLAAPGRALATNVSTIDPHALTVGRLNVDGEGNAYLAWERDVEGTYTTVFCKVPDGASCASPITLPSTEAVEEPFALLGTQPHVVYVAAAERGRSEIEIWTSTDGGESFSAAKSIKTTADAGTGDFLLDPAHAATIAKPTSDGIAFSMSNGMYFGETGNEAAPNLDVSLNAFYANDNAATLSESDWDGPVVAGVGYFPHVTRGTSTRTSAPTTRACRKDTAELGPQPNVKA